MQQPNFVIHKSESRGGANHGWLETKHAFSFAHYYNPNRMGFGALRVINEDKVAANSGFQMHPHKDMEIVTVPYLGSLSHTDTEGNSGEIYAGLLQRMSAGRGIWHSEMNKGDIPVHFYQIWIDTKENGIQANYEEFETALEDRMNTLTLVASGDEKLASKGVYIHQDAEIWQGHMDKGNSFTYKITRPQNGVYLQMANFTNHSEIEVNGNRLVGGDAVEISNINEFKIKAISDQADFLIMDVPITGQWNH
ncbi:MAG: pirin family protein [Candidatus Heimdallarchaeota archaeon]|nr:pirin family protein [Candidatus Heimdallarchaeota archaeon]